MSVNKIDIPKDLHMLLIQIRALIWKLRHLLAGCLPLKPSGLVIIHPYVIGIRTMPIVIRMNVV